MQLRRTNPIVYLAAIVAILLLAVASLPGLNLTAHLEQQDTAESSSNGEVPSAEAHAVAKARTAATKSGADAAEVAARSFGFTQGENTAEDVAKSIAELLGDKQAVDAAVEASGSQTASAKLAAEEVHEQIVRAATQLSDNLLPEEWHQVEDAFNQRYADRPDLVDLFDALFGNVY